MTNPSQSSSGLAITAQGLTKHYGDLVALDGLDLEVETGTVTALLGPNGAGKTTTVRLLATLEGATSGTATVAGFDIATQGDAVRSRISLTGQFAALEDNLTAHENLLLMARLRGYRRPTAIKIVSELVERFDIGEFQSKLIKNVSGGQRRRVDLAASLVVRPEILVLDEPTTGLDPRSRQVVWTTVRDLVAEGVTLLLTTQYLDEADVLADRIVLIDHGRTVANGSPTELKSQIGQQRVDITAVDSAGLEALTALLDGRFEITVSRQQRSISIPAPDDTLDLSTVSAVIRESGIAVDEIALRRPTLDDAFLALTTSDELDRDLDDLQTEGALV
jgi:daunorubicin resistance ABC transporter ATP-binding subunit